MMSEKSHNAALRCERRLAILERSETAKRCESLLNALLYTFLIPEQAKTLYNIYLCFH